MSYKDNSDIKLKLEHHEVPIEWYLNTLPYGLFFLTLKFNFLIF